MSFWSLSHRLRRSESKPAAEGAAATANPAVEAFTTAINAKLPMVNDAVITLLSSKSFDELYTTEGKEKLRLAILEKVQSHDAGR